MKFEHRLRLDKPQGDIAMNLREAFSRSKQEDQKAIECMQRFADAPDGGGKEAEHVMLEEVNKVRLNHPTISFKQAMDRVVDAFPLLHMAYLNSNGVKR